MLIKYVHKIQKNPWQIYTFLSGNIYVSLIKPQITQKLLIRLTQTNFQFVFYSWLPPRFV